MASAANAFFGNYITRNAFTIIAWAWLVLDYIFRLRKEREKIWRPVAVERRTSRITWLYIFIRYGGLIGQTINMVCTIILLSSPAIHPSVCSIWFWYQSALIQALFGAVQYFVMLRVDALYFGDRRCRTSLYIFWLSERVALMYIAFEVYHAVQSDATCLTPAPVSMNPQIGLIATIIAVQLFAWGMTLARIYRYPTTPLTKQLIRDGAVVCISIISFFVIDIPYVSVVDVLPHNTFALMITVFSNLGCALILNLQSLAVDEDVKTSHTGTSTWCLDTLEGPFDNNDDD